MKRRKRVLPEDKPKIIRRERISKHRPAEDLNVSLTYNIQKLRSYKGPEYYIRRYYVGAVCVAAMYSYEIDSLPNGNVCVHITSKPAEGGIWFKRRSKAQQLIVDELQRVPND